MLVLTFIYLRVRFGRVIFVCVYQRCFSLARGWGKGCGLEKVQKGGLHHSVDNDIGNACLILKVGNSEAYQCLRLACIFDHIF